MKHKLLSVGLLLTAMLTVNQIFSQNIGINATGASPAASAGLDVDFTNKGVLIPRVALTATNAAGPVAAPATSLLVYNTATAGAGATAVTPGYYYWSGAAWVRFSTGGDDWKITGNANATSGTHFLGTTNAEALDFRTNNTIRFRIANGNQVQANAAGTAALPFYTWVADPNTGFYSGGADNLRVSTAGLDRMAFLNNGEVVVGALTTVIVDDLFSSVSNVTLDWAVNGYSGFDGSGVYGQVTGGATIYAGVQGEYYGTHAQGAGVRGIYSTNTSGASFLTCPAGVSGDVSTVTGNYKFGVKGNGGNVTRSGGTIGNDFGVATGALGYYAANGNDYAVYGFSQAHTNGLAGGKMAGPSNPLGEFDNMVGLGIYGGVMGGWIKGLEYGANFSGKRYGTYVDGKTLTNDLFVVLSSNETNVRTASYASTSLSVDINAKGTANLVNGEAEVKFNKEYSGLISSERPIVVTVTPMGETNGVYIVSVNKEGFKIKENGNGTSNVSFSWIAIAEKAGYENPQISAEILSKEFDSNMDGVMHNDNFDYESKALWWNGSDVQFGDPSQIEGIVTDKKTAISKNMPDLAKPKTKKDN